MHNKPEMEAARKLSEQLHEAFEAGKISWVAADYSKGPENGPELTVGISKDFTNASSFVPSEYMGFKVNMQISSPSLA